MLRRNIEAIELAVADMRDALNDSSIPRTRVSPDAWNALSSDVLTILAHYGDSAIETAVKLDTFFQLVKRTQDEADRLVFFFQAEDGIRDVAVTGVQTCALPI